MKFTTTDNENDFIGDNCGIYYTDTWWYRHCYYSNLNGGYGLASSTL